MKMLPLSSGKTIALITLLAIIFLGFLFKFQTITDCSGCNLIIISVDTLRPDHMGLYGYDKNTTPNIDNWAKKSVVFTNIRTVVPSTYPSFASLMTGIGPLKSNILNNSLTSNGVSSGFKPIANNIPLLSEILHNNDYTTAAFINNPILDEGMTNFNRGFDIYSLSSEKLQGPDLQHQYKSWVNINNALSWLANNKNKKIFLWIHLMEPHSPYLPVDKYRCAFNKNFCSLLFTKSLNDFENERLALRNCQPKGLPQEKVDLFKTLYDGSIATSDELVGNILKNIHQSGLDKKTVVMFYGDHGEGFEHNYYFVHGDILNDSNIKIPLIVNIPNIGHKVVNNYLQNIQIMPFLLDVLHIKNSYKNSFFYSFVNGSKNNNGGNMYSISTTATKYSLQNNNMKYIYSLRNKSCPINGQYEELYDLKKDPGENNNLITKYPQIAKDMRSKLLKDIDPSVINHDLNIKNNQQSDQKNNKDIIDQIKSLGY